MGSILVLKVLRPESQLEAFVLREYDPRVNRVNRVFLNERTLKDQCEASDKTNNNKSKKHEKETNYIEIHAL